MNKSEIKEKLNINKLYDKFFQEFFTRKQQKNAIKNFIFEVLDELEPEKKPVSWQEIGFPNLITKQSEACGWNACRDEYIEKRKKLGL